MDVDSVVPGSDFVERIERAISSCDAVVVMIGDEWLQASDSSGRRRIEDAHDFVRLEIETALRLDVPIIPVLVERTRMPLSKDLPESMRRLTRHQGLELSDDRWSFDVRRLIRAIVEAGEQLASGSLLARTRFRLGALSKRSKLAVMAGVILLGSGAGVVVLVLIDSPPASEYKLASNASRAVQVEVPKPWSVVDRAFGPSGAGNGLVATLGLEVDSDTQVWTGARVFVGASTVMAKQLELDGLSPDYAISRLSAGLLEDWSVDGCQPAGEFRLDRKEYLGTYRRWSRCGGAQSSFWELAAATSDRKAVISMQVVIPDSPGAGGEDTARHALETFRVRPDRLEPQAGAPGGG